MKLDNGHQESAVTAEAAVWLVRLSGDDRTPEMEAAFDTWLKTTPGGEAAFEDLASIWTDLPGGAEAYQRRQRSPARLRAPTHRIWFSGMAVAACAIVGLAAALWMSQPQVYETRRGEIRTETLADGSVVKLNTDSKIEVQLGWKTRELKLVSGEARFDVAHDPRKPFIVETDDGTVKALGTSFIVRNESEKTTVILLKGKVGINPAHGSDPGLTKVLEPGERAVIASSRKVSIDRPELKAITAWEEGKVLFSNTPLPQAIAEMNRYSGKPIVLKSQRAGGVTVSGTFRTGDSHEFARSVVHLNKLQLRDTGSGLEIRN
ncbi:FecR family protein [Asticcacaulis sp. YBE204]|uniref:FecR family protein n=1 Tax=Asticcacaulis sp. YBE204 TaxID=1282363 RepID=UPI0003C3D9A8|nr:FecR family protein [Asticcacaulis sp. YBE204]ESQ76971.1 hypothetical protein AEYBE204_19030 [Asticcacaulis sp. YBE204]